MRARADVATLLLGAGSGSLLDVGVGSGRVAEMMAGQGWTVHGVDPSSQMIESARDRVVSARENLIIGRAEALPFADATFDAALALGVLEFTQPEQSVHELARVLKPGGRAIIGVGYRLTPISLWHRGVIAPISIAAKRIDGLGRERDRKRPWISFRRVRHALDEAGLLVERVEVCGCFVVPDPIDRLTPRLAYRAARAAERSGLLRRIFGSQRVLLARKP